MNTLLREDPRTAAPTNASGFPDDSTNETDVTGSRSYSQVVDDRTNSHPVAAVDDSTNDSPVLSSETVIIGINDSSSRGTQIVREEDFHYADDDTIGDRTDSTASPWPRAAPMPRRR